MCCWSADAKLEATLLLKSGAPATAALVPLARSLSAALGNRLPLHASHAKAVVTLAQVHLRLGHARHAADLLRASLPKVTHLVTRHSLVTHSSLTRHYLIAH